MNKANKRILIISNMYPSPAKKYAGIFVKNQFEELRNLVNKDESIEIFFMRRSFTSRLGSIKKYFVLTLRFVPKLFQRYDVIHLHFFYPLIILAWLYKTVHPKTKLIVTFHGSDINQHVNEENKKILSRLARKIDFTIPVGKEIAKRIKEKLNLETGMVLPVGINDRVFYRDKDIRKAYDFIFVGSFYEIKGIDIVIKAIEAMGKDVRFCIVGKGEHYEKLIEDKKTLGYDIHLYIDQSHDQLRELYNKSRFLFLPSRSEGFPTVTIEAMYCGVPVITSNIPQFKEQVNEGLNGFMFSLDEIDNLSTFLNEKLNISDSQYARLQDGALKSFKDLSLTNICRELIRIYRA